MKTPERKISAAALSAADHLINSNPSIPQTREVWHAIARGMEDFGKEGWKEATIAWTVLAAVHRDYAKGKDPFYVTRQADYAKAEDYCRAVFTGTEVTYKHKVRGSCYHITGDVRIQCETPLQDGEIVVLYRDINLGFTYGARRSEEFHDGRFEIVPNG